MAYVDTQYLLTASGTLPGGEVWFNTWCVQETDVASSTTDVIADFAAFYADFTVLLHPEWTFNNIRLKNLATDVVIDNPINPAGTGASAEPTPLPTQVAVRVSLKAPPNINGGPFLTGFAPSVLGTNGELDTAAAADIVSAVEDLRDNLASHDWQLCINRPTILDVEPVAIARVGTRFDIIRKRANELLENYSTITF